MTNIERNLLKTVLKRNNVTQTQVAEACGVNHSTVSLWLKGEVSSPALDKAIPAYVAGLERGIEITKAA